MVLTSVNLKILRYFYYPTPVGNRYDHSSHADYWNFYAFQERIVAPHLKHDYTTVCKAKEEKEEPATSKLSLLFRWLLSIFSLGKDDKWSQKDEL